LGPIYTLITEYYDFLLKSNSADASIDHTLSSISTAQMAHLIEPVTRQRDDQARLMNDSRKVRPLGEREPLGAVASGLPSSDRGQAEGASALRLAEICDGQKVDLKASIG
jgi:hypothetical protein